MNPYNSSYADYYRQPPITPVSILSDGNHINLKSWRPSLIYAIASQWKLVIVLFAFVALYHFFGRIAPQGFAGIFKLDSWKFLIVIFFIIPFAIKLLARIARNYPSLRKYMLFTFLAFLAWFIINVFIFGKNTTSVAIRTGIWNSIIGGFILVAIYRILSIRATVYNLTNEQITARQGLLAKTSHYIELYRLKDIVVNQNFIERIFGLMDVEIISIDAATPVFTLQGLPYTPELQTQIRNLAQQCRMKYNVYSIN